MRGFGIWIIVTMAGDQDVMLVAGVWSCKKARYLHSIHCVQHFLYNSLAKTVRLLWLHLL